jgi:hypothetical protein
MTKKKRRTADEIEREAKRLRSLIGRHFASESREPEILWG